MRFDDYIKNGIFDLNAEIGNDSITFFSINNKNTFVGIDFSAGVVIYFEFKIGWKWDN